MFGRKSGKVSKVKEDPPIEEQEENELLHQWHETLEALREQEHDNPTWEWPRVQVQLERLHALAQELRRKQSLSRARWQP